MTHSLSAAWFSTKEGLKSGLRDADDHCIETLLTQKTYCVQDATKLAESTTGIIPEASADPAARRSIHVIGENSTSCPSIGLNGSIDIYKTSHRNGR